MITKLLVSHQQKLLLNLVSFHLSTTAKSQVFSDKSRLNFQKERSKFNKNVANLRKAWQQEYEQKQSRFENKIKEERQQTVTRKAVALREKRKATIKKQEAAVVKEREVNRLYQENLAKAILNREDSDALQQKRYIKLINDLDSEKSAWINFENLEERIQPSLFENYASTGLITPFSGYWKTKVITFDERRTISPELESYFVPTTDADREKSKAQIRLQKEYLVENFLEGFVSTGEDRLKVKSVAKEVAQLMNKEDDDDHYNEYVDPELANHLEEYQAILQTARQGYDIIDQSSEPKYGQYGKSGSTLTKLDFSDDAPVEDTGYVEDSYTYYAAESPETEGLADLELDDSTISKKAEPVKKQIKAKTAKKSKK